MCWIKKARFDKLVATNDKISNDRKIKGEHVPSENLITLRDSQVIAHDASKDYAKIQAFGNENNNIPPIPP